MESNVYDVKSSHGLQMVSAGERLRFERQRLGISQKELADRVGVHRQTQVNYESDKRAIPPDYLDAALRAGIDTEYVATGFRSSDGPQVQQARNALLRCLLGALGYNGGEEQVQRAFEIWTSPSDEQIASGGMEGFAGQLVGKSPTVDAIVYQGAGIEADILHQALQAIESCPDRRAAALPLEKKAAIAAHIYRTALATGRVDPRDVTSLLALLD